MIAADGVEAPLSGRSPLAWSGEREPGARPLRVARVLLGSARRIAGAHRAARAVPRRPDAATAPRIRAFALSRLASDLCTLLGVRVTVSGAVPPGPVVLIANHLGYVDPLVLAGLVPCVPLAKSEVSGWPLLGGLGRQHGVLFVDRACARSGAIALRHARRVLQAGVSVLNFPEGTTTDGATVLPFRRGIFGLARLAGIPVVPVALSFDDPRLSWTGNSAFLPHYLRTAACGAGVVRVRFGCPMTPGRYGSAEDLAGEARVVVEHLLRAA